MMFLVSKSAPPPIPPPSPPSLSLSLSHLNGKLYGGILLEPNFSYLIQENKLYLYNLFHSNRKAVWIFGDETNSSFEILCVSSLKIDERIYLIISTKNKGLNASTKGYLRFLDLITLQIARIIEIERWVTALYPISYYKPFRTPLAIGTQGGYFFILEAHFDFPSGFEGSEIIFTSFNMGSLNYEEFISIIEPGVHIHPFSSFDERNHSSFGFSCSEFDIYNFPEDNLTIAAIQSIEYLNKHLLVIVFNQGWYQIWDLASKSCLSSFEDKEKISDIANKLSQVKILFLPNGFKLWIAFILETSPNVFTTKLILTELESETSISETISYKLLQWFSFPINDKLNSTIFFVENYNTRLNKFQISIIYSAPRSNKLKLDELILLTEVPTETLCFEIDERSLNCFKSKDKLNSSKELFGNLSFQVYLLNEKSFKNIPIYGLKQELFSLCKDPSPLETEVETLYYLLEGTNEDNSQISRNSIFHLALKKGYVSMLTQYVLQSKSQTQNLINPLTVVREWTLEVLKKFQSAQYESDQIFVNLVDLNIIVQSLLVHPSSQEGIKELETESIEIETTAQNYELNLWIKNNHLIDENYHSNDLFNQRKLKLQEFWTKFKPEFYSDQKIDPLLFLDYLYQPLSLHQKYLNFSDVLNQNMELNSKRKRLILYYLFDAISLSNRFNTSYSIFQDKRIKDFASNFYVLNWEVEFIFGLWLLDSSLFFHNETDLEEKLEISSSCLIRVVPYIENYWTNSIMKTFFILEASLRRWTFTLKFIRTMKPNLLNTFDYLLYMKILMENQLFLEAFYFQRDEANGSFILLNYFFSYCMKEAKMDLLFKLPLTEEEKNELESFLKGKKENANYLILFYLQTNQYSKAIQLSENLQYQQDLSYGGDIVGNYKSILPQPAITSPSFEEKMDTETEGPTTIHVTKSPFSTPLKSTPSTSNLLVSPIPSKNFSASKKSFSPSFMFQETNPHLSIKSGLTPTKKSLAPEFPLTETPSRRKSERLSQYSKLISPSTFSPFGNEDLDNTSPLQIFTSPSIFNSATPLSKRTTKPLGINPTPKRHQMKLRSSVQTNNNLEDENLI